MNDQTAHTQTVGQRVLLDACKEILYLEEVGLDDNFFEIGGNSLLALQVYEKVRREFGREIPLFDLSLPPTLRNLAQVVDNAVETKATEKFRALKCVQHGSPDEVPLFLVHGGDGNARVFQRVARNLDPRIPVYAFRWPGWDGRRGEKCLRSMAAAYKRELDSFQPHGAVRLGGYCIGGAIAIELACMLQDAGRTIEGPLFIWDAPNVGSDTYHKKEPWYSSGDYLLFKKMVDELERRKKELLPDCEPLTIPTQYSGSYEMIRRYPMLFTLARTLQIQVGTAVPIKLRLLFNVPVPVKWRWIYCMTTIYLALKRPFTTRYNGPVVYFRSDVIMGRPMNMLGWWSDPYMGFGELCDGDLTCYVVGGDHVDVLGQPICGTILNEICLKKNR